MKTKILRLSLIVFFLNLVVSGCQKDRLLITDPSEIILGKWELTDRGSYPDIRPVDTPHGYKEYLPDSVLKQYNNETNEFIYDIYWIDSLLHEGSARYRYNFKNNNKTMELENVDPGTYQHSIYKRLK